MCSVVDPLTWFILQRVHLTPHNTQFFGYTMLENATPIAQSLHPVRNVNPHPLDSKPAPNPTGNDPSSSTQLRTCSSKINLHDALAARAKTPN